MKENYTKIFVILLIFFGSMFAFFAYKIGKKNKKKVSKYVLP